MASLPENTLYEEVDSILNPTTQGYDLDQPLACYGRVGEHTAKKTLNGGQDTHPTVCSMAEVTCVGHAEHSNRSGPATSPARAMQSIA